MHLCMHIPVNWDRSGLLSNGDETLRYTIARLPIIYIRHWIRRWSMQRPLINDHACIRSSIFSNLEENSQIQLQFIRWFWMNASVYNCFGRMWMLATLRDSIRADNDTGQNRTNRRLLVRILMIVTKWHDKLHDLLPMLWIWLVRDRRLTRHIGCGWCC